jgi:multiple sugar transport system substrate-binding protein
MNPVRFLRTGWLGRWRQRHAAVFCLALGTVLGAVVTLAATYLVDVNDHVDLEPGELVIISGEDGSDGDQRQFLVNQWNATHRHNQARIIELSAIADHAHSEMVARAQSGRGDVDIYNLDVIWTAEFADAGYIRPLDDSKVDRSVFLQNPIRTCIYRDTLWALPFNTNAGLLYYRKDLVPQPPARWSELINKVDGVLAKGQQNSNLEAGYTGQLRQYEGLTVNAIEAIQAVAVGDMVRKGKVAISLDDLNEGIRRLWPSDSDGDRHVLGDSLTYDEKLSTQAFREGKVLFMRNWPVAYRDLSRPTDETGQPAVPAESIGITPLPGGSVLGGANLAIAANSAKPRAAQALIEFLTDSRSQQILFERGGLAATRTVVYQDPEVTKKYAYTQTLLKAVEEARPRPVTPCYRQFTEVFQNAVYHALHERKPLPDDFIHTLDAALAC